MKKYNIFVHGTIEEKDENVTNKFVDVCKKHLQIDINKNDLRNIHRIGKPEPGKSRPIIIEFLCMNKKNEVMIDVHKLKSTAIYISHDLCEEDLRNNKLLWDYKKLARSHNIESKIKKGKLIVNGIEYTPEEIKSDPLLVATIEKESDPKNIVAERITRQRNRREREDQTAHSQVKKRMNSGK
ncbi:hypothetical protein JTB14_015757 [Gonioctena quinquepunctata]|nr:hypothetical protein JTB14_015757 [Gonioctena quinquepunctata]